MLLNEHLSKALFREAGLATPSGIILPAETIESTTPEFPLPWVLKAQVLSGGRGKAGGVQLVKDKDEFASKAKSILDLTIGGEKVPFLRVEPAVSFENEFYLSFAVAREREALVLTTSAHGGINVEAGGKGSILTQNINMFSGPAPHQIRTAFFSLGLGKEHFSAFAEFLTKLYETVRDYGLLLAEINPLVLTTEGDFLALDGKIEIDGNVLDLRPELERFHEPRHLTDEENKARSEGFSFVKLSGWVGLLANGAGLAMATMDLLNFSGMRAANFLDLGGTADDKRMRAALELLMGDNKVRAVFINMYGGILSCESVAIALRKVLEDGDLNKPLVVRFAGNSATEGLAVLNDMGRDDVHTVDDMADALAILETLGPKEEVPSSAAALGSMESAFAEQKEKQKWFSGTAYKGPMHLSGNARVLVQGITGKVARLHTRYMQDYGTNVVAGVTPFKGGTQCEGVPVFNSVPEALQHQQIDASIIFVPGPFAADAILEAIRAEIPWVVCITEGIPQQDMLAIENELKHSRSCLIGPNTPGVILPGEMKMGIMPVTPFVPGPVAIFSRSGTLTYEAAYRLSTAGIGQRIGVGIGGDPFVGARFTDLMEMIRDDSQTEAVLILGEIGGRAEEDVARYVQEAGFAKPVLCFVAGQTAPPGKRLGHAGAILEESGGGISGKLTKLKQAGIILCPDLASLPGLVHKALSALD